MTTRRAAVAHLAWLTGLTELTGGCSSLLPPPEPAPVLALIDKLPADLPQAARARGVMLVLPPMCRPVLDTTRMAYSTRAHQIDYFARHEWAERPAQMLQPLIVRTLRAARCCTAVVAAPYAGAFDFSLRTELRELLQDFTTTPPQLRFALRVELSDRTRTLAAQDLEFSETMHAQNAEAGVDAANEAVAQALRAIVRLVIDTPA
jgi:cholesterol transport system auxiliary component